MKRWTDRNICPTTMPVILNADKVWFDESRELENLCVDVAAAGKRSERVAGKRRFGWVRPVLSKWEINQARLSAEALEIMVAERHPMQSRDQEIVNAAANMACKSSLRFYFSLDDPLMKHFGAETIKALFERLGIDKNESVEHHLINTAIRTAQEKIESKVGKDVPTVSAEDWFNLH
jgi:preprotein translocase subunit SecA